MLQLQDQIRERRDRGLLVMQVKIKIRYGDQNALEEKKKIERTNDEKMGVTFHGGHTQPPKQQERSETKDGESWLWEHTYVKVEWF